MRFSFLNIGKLKAALVAAGAVLLTTALLIPFRQYLNSTEIALTLLLIVLASSTLFGSRAGLTAAIVGGFCLNFFFLPPIYKLTISRTEDWAAFVAFLITAVIAGQLSGYARRRTTESEARQKEIERLYDELKNAFEQASEAEGIRRSEKLKSALLDAVTHDLRTPLTSIKASVTTLLDSEGGHRSIELDGERRLEFLSIIDEETDRLNGFIEGMVELAKVEAGSVTSGIGLVNIDEIMPAALRRAEPLPGGHRVVLKIEPELPLIRADARAVAEVLYNLIENAVKYSPGGSTITITATSETDRVLISVNDEGQGVPKEMRERVFEKFVRVGDEPGGLGLGLAIARGIIEAQNGHIRIEDGDSGIGTNVIITLPTD